MPIDKGNGNGAKGGKPRLVLAIWANGEPLAYKCSQCCQEFLLPEDRTPKEGMAELWAAFQEHIEAVHGCSAAWSTSSPRRNG